MLAAGAMASAGCTDIEDYPDGRMEFEDIFQNPKMVGAYMNECYADAVNSYSDCYGDKTYLASACDEAHDTDDATGGTMYQWNSGFTTPLSLLGNTSTARHRRCVCPNGTFMRPSGVAT